MITSTQNSLIKAIRKLQTPKGRREQNRLLLEGTHLIETANHTVSSLDVFCYTADWQAKNPQLWTEICQKSQRSQLVSPDVLASLATTVNPDGAIATLSRETVYQRPLQNLSLGLVLERLQDPGNLGTIMRTAVATGVEGLWVSDDTVELDSPKVLRASAGSWFHLPKVISEDLPTLLMNFKQQGIQVIATLPTAGKCYWDVNFSRPSVLVFGNEGNGLSKDLADLADQQVTIPQRQEIESLNVAIAVSVLLYEVQRQRYSQSI